MRGMFIAPIPTPHPCYDPNADVTIPEQAFLYWRVKCHMVGMLLLHPATYCCSHPFAALLYRPELEWVVPQMSLVRMMWAAGTQLTLQSVFSLPCAFLLRCSI
eukprot:RCo029487